MKGNTEIAKLVTDLRLGRVRNTLDPKMPAAGELGTFLALTNISPIINATSIYESIMAKEGPFDAYADHPCIAPPWQSAVVCYINRHGNTHAMVMGVADRRKGDRISPWTETDNVIDWDRVRWILNIGVFVGGWSIANNHPIATAGPVIFYAWAVYDDGVPADLHWYHILTNEPPEIWQTCALTTLAVLNFMNCRNVQMVEPKMERAERRRLERTGVKMNILNVLPAGVSSRSTSRRDDPLGVPLSTVNGHFAKYGPEFGRGLLFGKYAGRFWIPQHARGSRDHGVNVNDYNLEAQPASDAADIINATGA